MLKQILAAALLGCTLMTSQASSVHINTSTWLALHSDKTIYGITMKVGDQEAWVNGTKVELQGAPFVKEDVFYYPLQDLVELYGDSYELDGDRVTIDAGDTGTYTFTVGSTIVTAQDGTIWDNSHQQRFFLETQPQYPKESVYTPILLDGVLYAPLSFLLALDGPRYLSHGSQYVDSGFVIFDGKESANGFLGYEILTEFDALPAEKRESLVCLGAKGEARDYYNEVEYRGDGYSVFVLRLKPGERNSEQLDGLISAIIVDDPKYMTKRGLRVGDSAERAWELYGEGMLTQFGYELENGKISRFGFRSPYYSVCGIRSLFFYDF